MRMFDQADLNHDGQLDRAEAEAFTAAARGRVAP
jgi:hypothetical protein